MNSPIDIFLPWVNASDLEWQRRYNVAKKGYPYEEGTASIRFEDWENLRYWFRAIDKFMPWVHQVILATDRQVPDFLNLDSPKLKLVFHDAFIPKAYLPTYNSNTIEMNAYRIDELAENFIMFNDDIFPLQPLKESYFFQNDLPCDEAIENPIFIGPEKSSLVRYAMLNDMKIINTYFHKRDVQRQHHEKWFNEIYGDLLERNKRLSYWYDFVGFRNPHLLNSYHKSTFRKIWEKETSVLDAASRNHFRAPNDISHYVARYWQLCEGAFVPRKTVGRDVAVTINSYKSIAGMIKQQQEPLICINESCAPKEFVIIKKEINDALQAVFSEPCSFEKND